MEASIHHYLDLKANGGKENVKVKWSPHGVVLCSDRVFDEGRWGSLVTSSHYFKKRGERGVYQCGN